MGGKEKKKQSKFNIFLKVRSLCGCRVGEGGWTNSVWLDLWGCHCRKSHCASCSLQWWGDLLPGDCSLLWLSKVVVELLSCGAPVWVFRWVRDRHPTSPVFLTTLYWLLPCLIWWIPYTMAHLLFTPFYFFFLTFAYFYYEVFCFGLGFFLQGWLIDRH